MGWLRRLGRSSPPEPEPERDEGPTSVERAAPGIAAFFEGVPEDRSHTILDFGPASEGNLRVYSRYARRIRFADLLCAPPAGSSWEEALEALPRYPEPYDLVLAWNVMDRMAPEQRPGVMRRLLELTAPGARLYLVMDSSGAATTQPLRFDLLGADRVRQDPAGAPHPAWGRPLPAEVERLLYPFEVIQAFVLRLGMREYVAVRRESRR